VAHLALADQNRLRIVLDDAGAVYPLAIDPLLTGTLDPQQLEANQASASFGQSVASAGDVNGDGYADVIVGAPDYDIGPNEGAAFLFLGSATGTVAAPAATFTSDRPTSRFGQSVASAGDVNGDGYADLIVGARAYDNGAQDTAEGWVFIYLGSGTGI